MHIGKIIKRRRLSVEWTQEELATRAGIDTSNVSRIERGRQSLTEDTLKALSDAFGIPASELMAEAEVIENIEKDPISGRNSMESEEREFLRYYLRLSQSSRSALRQIASEMARNLPDTIR